jgi:hypothetical protein
MKSPQSTITAKELDELIKDWGVSSPERVDKFFPVRFWLLALLIAIFTYRLLLNIENTAHFLSSDPLEINRLMGFLYFRGWFVLVLSTLYVYSYLKSWYYGIISFAVMLIVVVNFSFDLFSIYHDLFDKPPKQLTFLIMARLLAMFCIYLNLTHYKNLPSPRDRLNIVLPFRPHRMGK